MGFPKQQRAAERPPLKVRERCLIDRHHVATLLSISPSLVSNWHTGGLMPAAIEIRQMVLWRRAEIQDWVLAGCPIREDWKWEATVAVSLPKYIETLTAEAVELKDTIDDLKARAAAGETIAHVRRQ